MIGILVGRTAEMAALGDVAGVAAATGRPAVGVVIGAAGLLVGAVSAHPHRAGPDDQVIANGQNHAPYVSGVSCGGDPAAYGLESAHHGPDAGTPGKADGCYMTTGGVAPGADVHDPSIH